MRSLLEVKEILRRFYAKNDFLVHPLVKFLVAFAALTGINNQVGFMGQIDNITIVLIVALMCSFLPKGFIVFFSGIIILLHFYALGLEVAVVGLCVFLLMALLFFRFSPADSLVVVLTPICFGLNIPYVIPVAMGLLGTPVSAISVSCGIVVYYLNKTVALVAPTLKTVEEGEMVARLRMIIDALLANKEMIIVIAAFAFTVMIVYFIRRMSIAYSWTIAIVAGSSINVLILLIGTLMFDTELSILWVFLGTLLSICIEIVIQFFFFNVDYNRIEKVQFEDDEYYYYVKAVPKMTASAPAKQAKRPPSGQSNYRQAPVGAQRNPAPRPANARPSSANVVSGRVEERRPYVRKDAYVEEIPDDYEEL